MKKPSDQTMRDAAAAMFTQEGMLEVDDGAPVSRAKGNPDKGAYVQAWVWIYDADAADGVQS